MNVSIFIIETFFIIMLGIRLYDTFNKAKDFFKKPIVHWSFG